MTKFSYKPNITVTDDLSPEDAAMLQALYSRSADSASNHLKRVKTAGSGKFMSQFYVGYGHKSIADCGSTTMFIEDVSILAAKAIQDWPLYCGQETSTRYIDMQHRDIIDPVESKKSAEILARWMDFYVGAQASTEETVRARYPKKEGEKQETYDKAVKARVFDSLRGFLPAGITTQLSWHTNLRQAGDHLNGLILHPAKEMKDIAEVTLDQLVVKYPSSGFDTQIAAVSGESTKDTDAARRRLLWDSEVSEKYSYHDYDTATDAVAMTFNGPGLCDEVISSHKLLFEERPRGCILPHFVSDFGQVTSEFLLDYGSWRDIQRHRNGVCRSPILSTRYGFETWYLDQLDDDVRSAAAVLLAEQMRDIAKISDDPVIRQYYTALGFKVPTYLTYALPALIYVMELRSGKAIHPTLRKKIHGMIHKFKEKFPTVMLHVDMDPNDWDVRRGNQTITAK